MSSLPVAIVGAGPAGCAAAVQCHRLGLSVRLFEASGQVGGLVTNAWSIENDPATGGPLSGLDYAARLRAHLDRFGLSPEQRTIHAIRAGETFRLTGHGGEVQAAAVIVATGTRPRHAGFAGETELAGVGVHYHVAEVRALTPGPALVVGGGEAALDYALSLANGGHSVGLLVRGTEPRANARLRHAVADHPAITLRVQTTVTSAVSDARGLAVRISTQTGEVDELSARFLLVAVGRTPSLPTLQDDKGAPLAPPAPPSMLTSCPGLVIAGDARLGALGQVGIAVGDGLQCAGIVNAWLSRRRSR